MAGAFVEAGANVVWSSRSRDRLDSAIDEATSLNSSGDATAITADVRSRDEIQRLVDATHDEYGEIDVFVNNAGVTQHMVDAENERKPVQDIAVENSFTSP